ncbi:MAG TPA: LiaF domain-containing protein [Gemmatimonadaceae bacterium]|nr:LiaF domain-containing protein [Gemmatimonadaceae bacterium]
MIAERHAPKRRSRSRATLALVGAAMAAALLSPAAAAAQGPRELHAHRNARASDSAAASTMHVELRQNKGRVHVLPADSGTLYDVRAAYDPALVRASTHFDDAAHTLHVSTASVSGQHIFGMHVGGTPDDRSLERNVLTVALPRDRDVDLSMNLRAGEGVLDLGGLAVSGASITHWGSALTLRFSTANRAAMHELVLSTTMAELNATDLANAHAERILGTVTAGGLDLDFGNAPLAADVDITLRVLLAGVRVAVPESVGVRVVANVRAGSISGLTKRDEHTWTSDNWETATRKLTIEAGITAGGITIERVAAP